ncbi:hypothetical protein KIW84_034125 [Lathyrus oleraceus]|uniref:Uncharacterized protein n=1 Tax=Pisum sativum TaxID=3888 RepID=A0A9D4Y0G8_PEA|nr:hypothetical protein KIW84_034125 [Pisum sativum]
MDAHLNHLTYVFAILDKHQFHLKPAKCSFCQSHIAYLGHMVVEGTVAPYPLKIQGVGDWPPPKSLKSLHGLLGLSGAFPTHFAAYKVVDLFVNIVCKLHGLPRSIVSDRDPVLYLRAFVHQKTPLWHYFLPWAEYHYNTSFHLSAGMTPYHVVYGKLHPSIPSYVTGTTELAASDDMLSSREVVLDLLKKNLTKAQTRMK